MGRGKLLQIKTGQGRQIRIHRQVVFRYRVFMCAFQQEILSRKAEKAAFIDRFLSVQAVIKDTMSLLQPTSNSVELCRNYEYVMYVLSVKFKR